MSHCLTLTDENFEEEALRSSVPVLVDFSATWCGPCKALEPIIADLANAYKETAKIAKLDIDDAPRTARKYGVRSVPVVMLFANGEVQTTMLGIKTRSHYKRELDVLVSGAPPAEVDVAEEMDVFKALQIGDPAIVEKVLARMPAQAEARDSLGLTPLSIAIRRGELSLLNAILKFSPEMDAAGLAAAGRTDELRALLEGNAEIVHEAGPDGLTPLHIAASWNEVECAEALMDAGADMNAPASVVLMRRTPGQTAAMHGSVDVLRKMLERGFDANAQFDPQIGSLLHLAAIARHDELRELLIEYGADELARNAAGQMPREAAERQFRIRAVEKDPLVMLLRGNKATAAELDDYLNDHPARIDELLDVSAGPMTPLELALASRDQDRINVVLQHRPNLAAADLAALDRADDLAKLLDDNPDAASQPNARGMSPIEMAAWFGARASVELLLNADPAALDPAVLSKAIAQPDEAIWQLLADRGADFAAAHAKKPEDFIAVVALGNAAAIRFLIEQGIDLGLEHPTLGTMLDYARTAGKSEIALMLERASSS